MDNLLEIKDLRVEFHLNGKVITAVDGLNLNIAHNETLVLAGESGSGKTISSLAITRNLPQNARIVSGRVSFSGRDMRMKETSLRSLRNSKPHPHRPLCIHALPNFASG